MMLWGMTLQPGYEYTEFVDDEVRLSMASLECRPRKSQVGTVDLASHVVLTTARGEFLLCTLEKGPMPQQSLDLVLQPREKVTFSVEGTGIVHLMGYTSEGPGDEQQGEDLPAQDLPPQLMPPSVPEEDPILEEQEEDESIIVKNEPESVVIPILEEALEDMDEIAKNETDTVANVHTGMQGPSHMQGNMPPGSEEDYPYQDMSEEGWSMQTPEMAQADPGSRIDSTPFTQGRVAPGANVPSTSYPQSRHAGESRHVAPPPPASTDPGSRIDPTLFTPGRVVPGANVPSTSYSQSRHAGESRHVAPPPASTGVFYPSQEILQSAELTDGSERSYRNFSCSPSGASVKSRIELGGDKSNRRKRKQICTTDTNPSVSSNPAGRTITYILCRYCDRPFRLRSNCKVHERRHTGERPFKCQYCPKLFVSGSERKAHENIHTGAKPFKCRYCEKGFASIGNRGQHEMKHRRKLSV